MTTKVLGDRKWLTWRNIHGPARVVLHSCYLTDLMAKTLENLLKRPTARRKERGQSRNCETHRDPIYVHIFSKNRRLAKLTESLQPRPPGNKEWIKVVKKDKSGIPIEWKIFIWKATQYRALRPPDIQNFFVGLRQFKPIGYGINKTTNLNDQGLLHYYFNEPPKGAWIKWTIYHKLKRWKVNRFQYDILKQVECGRFKPIKPYRPSPIQTYNRSRSNR
jgi:hypothetical protein